MCGSFELDFGQTHLSVKTDTPGLKAQVLEELIKEYDTLSEYILCDPFFESTYEPYEPPNSAPQIAKRMSAASLQAGVGPMASVAGTFSEIVGEYLLALGANEALVENGGDIYLKSSEQRKVLIHAGSSPLSDRFSFLFEPKNTPCGVCTSSGSVGHSVSLGDSDSVTVVASSCPLADASATSIANHARGEDPINSALEHAKEILGIGGVLVILGNEFGAYGNLPEIVDS